ncbi:NAD-dependent epimerase/dehydratase family protein [Rubrolithibacter danxiaensis]|uniref:NAD-dependent epimerase/dehydratase family protein n=1 Tax=Rubrolithibacter danxiaensis TaxID=3390805 RepID=UPI003BF7DEAC
MMKERILVIGGSGFIGLNLINYVNSLTDSCEITVLSRSDSRIVIQNSSIKYVKGSYGDLDLLSCLFKRERFTKVFHFACTTIPLSSNLDIKSDINDNLICTINLLEIMRSYSCHSIVYLSSGGAVYGEYDNDKLKEEYPCQPISSYGILKWTVEQYIKLYHKQYGFDYLILRLSNPYGPFHHSNRQGVINIAVRKALKREPFVVWGNGNQSKDYIFVENIIEVLFELVTRRIQNETINIGSGESFSLNFILGKIKELIPTFIVEYQSARPSDIMSLSLNVNKLREMISFKLTPFDQGLQRTIEWERKNYGQ